MKNHIRMLLVVLCLSMTGCGGWIQQLKDNPVAALQQGQSYITTALGLAQTAFNAFVQTTGVVSPQELATFNRLVGDTQRGLVVANDGLRIAAHLKAGAPDVNALLADSRQAMGNIAAFLSGLRQPTGQAADPLMREAIAAAQHAAEPVAY